MAKKETTKKVTKKVTSRKRTPKKVIEEVATSIIENTEKAEVAQEALEAILNEEPIIENYNEPEYMPTAEDLEKDAKEFETMNGDPSVVTPLEEAEDDNDSTLEIQRKAFRDTFKEVKNNKPTRRIDNTFGYSWNGVEIDF